MLQDHVPLLFGSDTPGVDGFGNPPGLNGRLELQNWADAGAPLSLILRAATLDNATALGLSHELGSIEVGREPTCSCSRKIRWRMFQRMTR